MSGWDADQARFYVEMYGEHGSHPLAVGLLGPQPGDVVVDLGCGGGNTSRLLAARGAVVHGVDPLDEMIFLAEEATEPGLVTWHLAAAEALPFEDGSVDKVLACHVVHHFDDVMHAVDEILRVLRPGGTALFVEEDVRGRMGHGDSPLTDPDAVRRYLLARGYADAAVLKEEEGPFRIVAVRARRP